MTKQPRDKGPKPARPNPRHKDNYPHHEKGASVCRECGLVLRQGRWIRGEAAPADAKALCPACTRVQERNPAGTLVLDAAFLPYQEEIQGLVKNEAAAEAEEHPLERVIALEPRDGGLVVTTTGVHLAQRIAHKLERRFHRDARFRYADEEQVVRVDWPTR